MKHKERLPYRNQKAALIYIPDFFLESCFDLLAKSLNWQQNEIRVYGKLYPEPRLTAWYGEPYTYSNIHWPKQAFAPELLPITQRLLEYTGFTFNSVLANYYRHGDDSMGWHSDNEKEMDTSLIASCSFGESRKLKFRHKSSKEQIEIELENNSLLLMHHMQDEWQHSIPKTKKVHGGRINLTFRRIIHT